MLYNIPSLNPPGGYPNCSSSLTNSHNTKNMLTQRTPTHTHSHTHRQDSNNSKRPQVESLHKQQNQEKCHHIPQVNKHCGKGWRKTHQGHSDRRVPLDRTMHAFVHDGLHLKFNNIYLEKSWLWHYLTNSNVGGRLHIIDSGHLSHKKCALIVQVHRWVLINRNQVLSSIWVPFLRRFWSIDPYRS